MRIRLSVVGRGVGCYGGGVYVFGREKVRPARSIHPKFGIFVLAGRVFSHQPAAPKPCRRRGALQVGGDGGFAPCEAFLRRVAGVSEPWMAQFPPIGGGAARVCKGAAAKAQTHWVKNAEKGLFWLNGSAFWRIRPLAWCGIRTRATPPPLRSNVARNSQESVSNHEHRSLELQRFWMIFKNDRRELCATFGGRHP